MVIAKWLQPSGYNQVRSSGMVRSRDVGVIRMSEEAGTHLYVLHMAISLIWRV